MTSQTNNQASPRSPLPAWWRFPALFVIVATPAVASWLAIRVLGGFFYQPAGGVSRALWIAQALGVALVVTVIFQMLLRKAKSAQVLGGLGALLEVPTVGAIGATATIPASAPFIAAVSIAAVATTAVTIAPPEPATALAFEDPIEVEAELGDSGVVGGELDIPVNREVGGADSGDAASEVATTTTTVADSGAADADVDNADEQASTGDASTTGESTTTTTATGNPGSSSAGNNPSPTPTTPTTAPNRPSAPTTAAPVAAARPTTTAAPTTAAPTTTTAAPTTTTTAAPTTAPPTTAAPTTTAAPPQAPTVPTGSGFVILDPSTIDSLVQGGDAEVASGFTVLIEAESITLGQNLNVNLGGSTPNEVSEAPNKTIPAGTAVCVYYVHGDVADQSNPVASITFPGQVLGHTDGSEDSLHDTANFEVSGVDYAIDRNAGTGRGDLIAVSGNSIELSFRTNETQRDDIRVFVACG